MTDRDLMQQALEALEINQASWPEKTAVIAALRERLARQEPICDGCGGTIAQHTAMLNCRCDSTRFCDDWPRCDPPCHIGKRSSGKPARQEQEPVGQLQEESYGRGHVMWFNKPPNQTMLYTAPQPAQQPLTDVEIASQLGRITALESEASMLREQNTYLDKQLAALEFAREVLEAALNQDHERIKALNATARQTLGGKHD